MITSSQSTSSSEETTENLELSSKYIIKKDPIYKQIKFPASFKLERILNSKEFRRLSYIKQLSTCFHTFPGATHCRYEHSIGVGYLAYRVMTHLSVQQPSLEIQEKDIRNLTIAGILHDIGHAVYSHVFDKFLVPQLIENGGNNIKDPKISTWNHEKASVSIAQVIFKEHSEYLELDNEDEEFITQIILGEAGRFVDKGWMFQIVNNSVNSLDVDKLDYIVRDSHHIGLQNITCDVDAILDSMRVIRQNICYNTETAAQILQVFSARYYLFREVYQCPSVNIMHYMLTDALVYADAHFHFLECLNDPVKYTKLTDEILILIRRSKDLGLLKIPQLSRNLLKRIDTQDLYKIIGKKLVQSIGDDYRHFKDINYELFKKFNIRIFESPLNYGAKNENPLNKILFYDLDGEQNPLNFKEIDFSYIQPMNFSEIYIYAYCTDNSMKLAAEKEFENAWNKYFIINETKGRFPSTISAFTPTKPKPSSCPKMNTRSSLSETPNLIDIEPKKYAIFNQKSISGKKRAACKFKKYSKVTKRSKLS